MKKQEKTNVMRLLDQKKIPYVIHDYSDSGVIAGEDVAKTLGENPDEVFKTLVTAGKTKQYYVFLVPVCKELNLKKAAKAVGEKSIEMIKSKELLPLTGYVHGGCSPIGMKKVLPTTIDISAENLQKIFFSAGKIGFQVEVNTSDLSKILSFSFSDITD